VNNTVTPAQNVSLRARVFSKDGKMLFSHEEKVNALSVAETESFPLTWPAASAAAPVFIKLELWRIPGSLISENFYWYSQDTAAYRQLNNLAPVSLTAWATESRQGNWARVLVHVANRTPNVALMSKLTVRNPDGTRVLPAYYSDNYISLLPGESREIESPASAAKGKLQVGVSGWNVQPR
jgi:hypothetical protein